MMLPDPEVIPFMSTMEYLYRLDMQRDYMPSMEGFSSSEITEIGAPRCAGDFFLYNICIFCDYDGDVTNRDGDVVGECPPWCVGYWEDE